MFLVEVFTGIRTKFHRPAVDCGWVASFMHALLYVIPASLSFTDCWVFGAWLPSGTVSAFWGTKRYCDPGNEDENCHHETCFSVGITASICRSQVGVCLETYAFGVSECIALFLERLAAVIANYGSTTVTEVASLSLSGYSALCRLLLN